VAVELAQCERNGYAGFLVNNWVVYGGQKPLKFAVFLHFRKSLINTFDVVSFVINVDLQSYLDTEIDIEKNGAGRSL
jgi:hypothetical protein